MKADKIFDIRGSRVIVALTLLVTTGLAAGVTAQTVDFEQLVYARQTTALIEHDGLVIGGLKGGGLVLWQAADPRLAERLTAGEQLSGNDITDLFWSGQHLWVATRGGGMTRITDVAGERSFRQYASNLGSLNVTSVTGVLIGQSERIYYGMDGGGVGLITDGLSGTIFTAEQDDLISDDVNAVQIYAGDLFVGTPAGVSRFTNNLFSDQNAGLTSLEVHDLTLASDGDLIAGTAGGVFRWDDGSESWSLVGSSTAAALEVSCADGLIYARSFNVRVFDGTTWQQLIPPPGVVGAIHAGQDFWIGGQAGVDSGAEFVERNAYLGRLTAGDTFEIQEFRASQVLGADGVTFSDGAPYLGAAIWQSVISSRHDGIWQHVRFQPPSPQSVGNRLSEGIILAMATGPDDVVWASLYAGTGLARLDPATGVTDLIRPSTSGLLGRQVVNLIVHPDGPVITMHDQENEAKVEILVDPAQWADSASWLTLPSVGGLGPGPSVWDAVVQRRDVIWFAVQDVGVVRWDINGELAGPNAPLTWFDQSDDRWDAPVASVFGSVLDLKAAFGLEVGSGGSIWVGGSGLLEFSYDERTRVASLLTSISDKSSPQVDGLINANVSDVARDVNGHIWVTTASGINRVRGSGQDVVIDAYVDLGNYFANPTYQVLYSPTVISSLPGRTYKKVVASADGRQLLVSADQGVSLITVGRGTVAPTLDSAYLFPNPFSGRANSKLKLGGLEDDAVAAVQIYNLTGQLVYTDDEVSPETGFWPGTNRVGEEVASGMYVVRVTSGGMTRTLTLAVVR